MTKIDSVGYDAVHPDNFRYDIPEGFQNYILVVTTTPAYFWIQGTVTEYPAHTAILYPPGQKIWYGASREIYSNHWIRFSSDESFVLNFPQQGIPFPVSDPEYCHRLFQLLTWENQELVISSLLRILFDKLHEDLSKEQNGSHDHELLSLRRRISTSPEYHWNVSEMADELHISAGHLQFLYKQKFQISCMDDVIHFRLQKARDLLTYTTQSIAQIAEQCGYNNTEHFCRQFRKLMKESPGKYRKTAAGQENKI